jgi:hypothetical protein
MTVDDFGRLTAAVEQALVSWQAVELTGGPDLSNRDQFERFLASHLDFRHPDAVERAAVAAVLLAIDRPLWSSPADVLALADQVRGLLIARLAVAADRVGRAPEFAIAHLLGWPDRTINWTGRGLDGIPPRTRWLALQFLGVTVESCFNWLKSHVIGFPDGEEALEWAQRVLNRLIAVQGRCTCWLRAAGPSFQEIDAEDLDVEQHLRGNARAKARTCLAQHNIRAWDPGAPLDPTRPEGDRWTLWRFLQRAAKGFLGTFRPAQFPTGVLWDLWQAGAEADRPDVKLLLAKVALRLCPTCKTATATESCPNRGERCYRTPLTPDASRLEASRAWIILADGGRGGFAARKVWTCDPCGNLYLADRCLGGCPPHGPHDRCPLCSEGHLTKKDWVCGNTACGAAYPAVRCRTGCPTDGSHDRCPSCDTRHPRFRPRPQTVYFYQPPGPPPAPPPPPGPTPATPLAKALRDGLREAAGHYSSGWKGGLVQFLADGLSPGRPEGFALLREAGRVDWEGLYRTLGSDPDAPGSPADLRDRFLAEVRPTLVAVFRNHLERAGFDRGSIDAIDPEGPSEEE